MQARRIARELSLLSVSQIASNSGKLEDQQLQDVIMAAVRTLTTEVQETLETASAEVKRGNDRLLTSETRASDVQSARVMVQEALQLAQTAINRLGMATELPELIQLTNQKEVRAYVMQVISAVNANITEIDRVLTQALVDWQLSRLARIDRDILRIAVAEILYLGVPDKVAINEAVELAKRYSGEDGYRFINGVLRRVTDQLRAESSNSNAK